MRQGYRKVQVFLNSVLIYLWPFAQRVRPAIVTYFYAHDTIEIFFLHP